MDEVSSLDEVSLLDEVSWLNEVPIEWSVLIGQSVQWTKCPLDEVSQLDKLSIGWSGIPPGVSNDVCRRRRHLDERRYKRRDVLNVDIADVWNVAHSKI